MTRRYCTVKGDAKETGDLLRKFWELEELPIKDEHAQAMTRDETKAVERAKTTQVLKD